MSQSVTLPRELSQEAYAAAGDAIMRLPNGGATHHDAVIDAVWSAIAATATDPRPIASAPKDGTMLWLLVDYSDGGGPLADDSRAWTIGFNNFENDEEDRWRFAGWCWSHDHFTEGSGRPYAWKPIGFELEAVGE